MLIQILRNGNRANCLSAVCTLLRRMWMCAAWMNWARFTSASHCHIPVVSQFFFDSPSSATVGPGHLSPTICSIILLLNKRTYSRNFYFWATTGPPNVAGPGETSSFPPFSMGLLFWLITPVISSECAHICNQCRIGLVIFRMKLEAWHADHT